MAQNANILIWSTQLYLLNILLICRFYPLLAVSRQQCIHRCHSSQTSVFILTVLIYVCVCVSACMPVVTCGGAHWSSTEVELKWNLYKKSSYPNPLLLPPQTHSTPQSTIYLINREDYYSTMYHTSSLPSNIGQKKKQSSRVISVFVYLPCASSPFPYPPPVTVPASGPSFSISNATACPITTVIYDAATRLDS